MLQYWLSTLTQAGYNRIHALTNILYHLDVNVSDAEVEAFLEMYGLADSFAAAESSLNTAYQKVDNLLEKIDAIEHLDDDVFVDAHNVRQNVGRNPQLKKYFYREVKSYLACQNEEKIRERNQPEIDRIYQTIKGLKEQLMLPRTEEELRTFIEGVAKIVHYEIKSI